MGEQKRREFKVLVSDQIAPEGLERLLREVEVDVRLDLKPAELVPIINDYDALVVRSQTRVTREIIEAGHRLQVIGRAGVGVDNIDVEAATQRGIVVVNAPEGNTIAAAEHTIAMMLAITRHIPQANSSLRSAKWERSRFVGVEVRGKVLGLIGLGRVGTEVAKRAQGFEMEVMACDPFISQEHAKKLGITLVDLDTLLRQSDYVSIHAPLTSTTRKMIGGRELTLMKPTARFINCARGELVDEEALYRVLEEGRIAGAAIDVFSVEPAVDNILLKSDKVIATPHLGASTEEAQLRVALDVAEEVIAVLHGRPVKYAVNLPLVPPEALRVLSPYMSLAQKLGELYTQLVEERLTDLEIGYYGEIAQYDTGVLRAAAIKGLLGPISEENITLVNADLVAKNRGLHITERKSTEPVENYTNLIALRLAGVALPDKVAGTVVTGEPHIVEVGPFRVDIVPSDSYLLISYHRDRPGIVGKVGTLLGTHDINISFMQVGRKTPRGDAMMVMGLDEPPSPQSMEEIRSISDLNIAILVKL